MSNQLCSVPKSIAVGICLSLLSILLGFSLGGAFGFAEDSIKNQIKVSGDAVLQSIYKGDVKARDAVVKKSWEYLKRAHLHGDAIGTASLASITILILLCRLGFVAQASAVSFGAGSLLYSLFWLLAGFMAPELGSTGAAKESLSFIAIPGAGLSIMGVCGTIFSVAKTCFFRSSES